MEPTVKRISLKRFRSIPFERIDFDNPTIFVGRNGSGKSNLVSVFRFLAEAMAAPLQAVFDKAGGISSVRNRSSGKSYPPNLGLRVDFGRSITRWLWILDIRTGLRCRIRPVHSGTLQGDFDRSERAALVECAMPRARRQTKRAIRGTDRTGESPRLV